MDKNGRPPYAPQVVKEMGEYSQSRIRKQNEQSGQKRAISGRTTGKSRKYKGIRLNKRIAVGLVSLGIIGTLATQALTNSVQEYISSLNTNHITISNLVKYNEREDSIVAQEVLGRIQLTQDTKQIEEIEKQAEQIRELEEAIEAYERLEDKEDRNTLEELEYIHAYQTIGNSRGLLLDTYTDMIQNKVAQAYGITKLEDIQKIEVHDYINTSDNSHNPTIDIDKYTAKTEDDIRLVKKSLFDFGKDTMPDELEQAVMEARTLLDADDYYDTMNPDDFPYEAFIRVFHNMEGFSNLQFEVKENGDLKTIFPEKEVKNETKETKTIDDEDER